MNRKTKIAASAVAVVAIFGGIGAATGGGDDHDDHADRKSTASIEPKQHPSSPNPTKVPTTHTPDVVEQPTTVEPSDDPTAGIAPYDLYSAVISTTDYPVLPESDVESLQVTFCDPTQTPVTLALGVQMAVQSGTIDAGNASAVGGELGAVVGAYCPDRADTMTQAFDLVQNGQ